MKVMSDYLDSEKEETLDVRDLFDFFDCYGTLTKRPYVLSCRPQLHDIVLDYVVNQHSKEVLSCAHRIAVELFRSRRPATHGWEPDNLSMDDHTGIYIVNEASYHIRGAVSEPTRLS